MPNRLAKETSPYLRQHAENPVDWYPWGEEAFRRAREHKAIHLSVGYAACHWCHVMAHESFENPDIARLMNERFVNVQSVHRTYLPARVVALAEDVPTGEGRYPVDGQPTAYVCRNRTRDARVTSAHALVERCVA